MSVIRVVIVEDDDEIRSSMQLLFSRTPGLHIVGSYGCAEDFMVDFPVLEADVVLMDITLPGMSGIECVKELKPQREEVQYLMCTVHEDQERTFAALCAGATGYILKNSSPGRITDAIIEIHQGGSPMSALIARYLIKGFQGQPARQSLLNDFTPREQEMLQFLAMGYPYKEIADKLFLSIETIRTYIRHIYEKLHVHSRTDALNKVFPKN